MGEGYLGYRLLLFLVILALNAYFSAAEVALISARRVRLQQSADKGDSGAKAALLLLANTERLLSVMQLGVTLASLGLGWAGEDTLFEALAHLFRPLLTPATQPAFHAVAFGIAFAVMSYAHVVIGEVVPKNLALERAERLAIAVSPSLLLFYRVSGPFVVVIERTASLLSRWLGLRGITHGGGHSPEELKFMVQHSKQEGHLSPFEEKAIQHLIDLPDYVVREIMVPRNRIISVSVDATLDYVLRLMIEHQYSRLPVYEDAPEKIIGVLHIKDLLPIWEERRSSNFRRRPVRAFDLRRILRKPLVVPETKPLTQLLEEFRESHLHLAIVVDEFGTITGVVTLEDVLEYIVGEIEDEHDERRQAPLVEADIVELDGSTSLRDLQTQYGIELPTTDGFETLAGFLLYRLGHLPEPGETVDHEQRRYVVLERDRNRIAKVRIEKLELEPAVERGSSSEDRVARIE